MNDLTVKIAYRNKNLEKVGERTYDLQQYVGMIKYELMKVIMDVEDEFIAEQNGKQKAEWSAETINRFQKIRHKLLDQANAIERLPSVLCYKNVPCNSQNVSEFISDIINKGKQ